MSAAAHTIGMIGMDGTSLHNGNWLQPGAAVVYALPFGAAALLPQKGDNFVRMWTARRALLPRGRPPTRRRCPPPRHRHAGLPALFRSARAHHRTASVFFVRLIRL